MLSLAENLSTESFRSKWNYIPRIYLLSSWFYENASWHFSHFWRHIYLFENEANITNVELTFCRRKLN